MASTQSSIFGGLPYEKYVYFDFLVPRGDDLLEHSNSYVGIGGPAIAEPEEMVGGAAHEFFHLWNVKRIRPAEMWPYDYSREKETPLLWVSEGFSLYYSNVSVYRAGLRSRKEFLDAAGAAIAQTENSGERNYTSPAEASISTWQHGTGGIYYAQGQNLAALLDLSIRHDTGGRASLDDVMRGLYREFYLRGKGFTTEDMIGVIDRLTKQDYHDFFRRYVWGVEVPPYEAIFGYAGLRVEKKTSKAFRLGMGLKRIADGKLEIFGIAPDGPAAGTGLLAGDVIEKVDGKDPLSFRWQTMMGETYKLTIRRTDKTFEIPFKIGSRDVVSYSIAEMKNPTPGQLKIRDGWLATNK